MALCNSERPFAHVLLIYDEIELRSDASHVCELFAFFYYRLFLTFSRLSVARSTTIPLMSYINRMTLIEIDD